MHGDGASYFEVVETPFPADLISQHAERGEKNAFYVVRL
jgi:hypothetical protein